MQSPPFPSTNHLAPRYAISSIPQYKSFSSSLCNLLHSPVISSLLGPNILLNTLFSNTLSFLSSHNDNDQVSHPYKTAGKIIVLYILIFKFFNNCSVLYDIYIVSVINCIKPDNGHSNIVTSYTSSYVYWYHIRGRGRVHDQFQDGACVNYALNSTRS